MGDALPPPRSPFVGRDRELGVLRHALDGALAGHGGLVLIGGEAGIGKTALAEAVCREAAERGALVLVGRCYDLTETPPYGPWVELFGQYVPVPSDDLPLPHAFAQRGSVGDVTSQSTLFQQVLEFLRAAAATQPIVLLLDDLHWADLASLDLLRFLARSLATLPVLLVVTYRADELTRRHPLYALLPILVREASATRIDLRPLRPEAIAALIQARYHLPDAAVTQLVAYLTDRSEGNPFFLGELLRTLEEEEILRSTGEGWSLGALAGVQIPPLLRQVIDRRLARLDDDAQTLLAVAAVIGQDVPFDIWASVSERDEATLLDTVEQAMVAQLVDATLDGTGFRFAHALIREALYEGFLPLRRRVLHRKVGDMLAAMPTPDPDTVASHFQRAGDERAVQWLIAAGERAQRAYALSTAATRYEAALVLLEASDTALGQRGWLLYRLALLRRHIDLPQCIAYLDAAMQIAETIGDGVLAAATLFVSAFLRANNGETTVVRHELAAGVTALESLSPSEYVRLNTEDGLPPTATNKTWRGALIFHLALAGHYAEAVAMGEQFIAQTVAPTASGALRGFAYGGAWTGLGIAYAMQGEPDAARRAFAQARTTFQTVENYLNVAVAVTYDLRFAVLPYQADRVAERHEVIVVGTQAAKQAGVDGYGQIRDLLEALNHMLEGNWAEADAYLRASRSTKHGSHRQLALRHLIRLRRHQGEHGMAAALMRELLPAEWETEPGNTQFDLAVEAQRLAAMLCIDARELASAQAWLETHDRWLAWNDTVLGRSEGQALWARFHRQTGDSEQAYACAQSALAHATNPRQPLALLAVHRLLGELDTGAGRYDDAGRHLDESLRLAEVCAAPYERALTLLVLAEMCIATGDPQRARTLLEEARTICARLGAKPALARADVLLVRLSPTSPAVYPAGLSAREVEVLRLVAHGLTDRQVADHLFLSPRTVSQHLRSIYNKLGVSTRAAATHFAVANGIA